MTGWKPNKKKFTDAEHREKIEAETREIIEKNTKFYCSMLEKYKDKFTKTYATSLSGLCVYLKHGENTGYQLSVLDKDFEEVLTYYLESNL